MKIFQTLEEAVESVNPCKTPFIVKGYVDKDKCDKVLAEVGSFHERYSDNEKFFGENWFYEVNKHDTQFHSFMFNNLIGLPNGELIKIFEKLFNAYVALGQDIQGNYDNHLSGNVSGETINPLVFWYPHGVGKFDWHQHPPKWQNFQLLVNLTQPVDDYEGGFTHIEMDDGHIEIFDHQFEKGDMFSFPYTFWHKVDPIKMGKKEEESKRVSLLMPIHPRVPVETKIRSESGDIY